MHSTVFYYILFTLLVLYFPSIHSNSEEFITNINVGKKFVQYEHGSSQYVLFAGMAINSDGLGLCLASYTLSQFLHMEFGLVPYSNSEVLKYEDVKKYVDENWPVIKRDIHDLFLGRIQSHYSLSDLPAAAALLLQGAMVGFHDTITEQNYAIYLYAYQTFIRETRKNNNYCHCTLPGRNFLVLENIDPHLKCTTRFAPRNPFDQFFPNTFSKLRRQFTYPEYWHSDPSLALNQYLNTEAMVPDLTPRPPTTVVNPAPPQTHAPASPQPTADAAAGVSKQPSNDAGNRTPASPPSEGGPLTPVSTESGTNPLVHSKIKSTSVDESGASGVVVSFGSLCGVFLLIFGFYGLSEGLMVLFN